MKTTRSVFIVEGLTWAIVLAMVAGLVYAVRLQPPAPDVPGYEEPLFLQDSTLQARAIEVAKKQLEYYILLESYIELCREITGQSARSCLLSLSSSASSSSSSSQEL